MYGEGKPKRTYGTLEAPDLIQTIGIAMIHARRLAYTHSIVLGALGGTTRLFPLQRPRQGRRRYVGHYGGGNGAERRVETKA